MSVAIDPYDVDRFRNGSIRKPHDLMGFVRLQMQNIQLNCNVVLLVQRPPEYTQLSINSWTEKRKICLMRFVFQRSIASIKIIAMLLT